MHRSNRARLLVVLVCASVLAGCGTDDNAAADEPQVSDTIALDPTIAAPTSEVTTTSSTAAPTTTEEPTTTAAPKPKPKPKPKPNETTTTLPASLRPVEAPAAPFVAVGQASGGETARIQERLLTLGYWNSGTDGTYGLTTTQAVMAFQKYMALPASGAVDQATADALTNVTERPRGLSTAGDLIEIDKQRQLLFVVRGGVTELVLNTSTGSGAEYTEEDKNSPGEMVTGVSLTPNGLFRVDRERPEGWWEGDLGEIYRPKYFRGGIAVHGSNSIPNYPASHGCVRVSVPAMDMIWQFNVMPLWSTVWVHEGI